MSGTKSHSQTAPATKGGGSHLAGKFPELDSNGQGTSLKPIALVLAHGQSGGESVNGDLQALVEDVDKMLIGVDVRFAVLNGEPGLEKVIHLEDAHRPLIVFPHLLSSGFIVSRIMPRQLRTLVNQVYLLPPLGVETVLPELTADAICRQANLADISSVLVAAHGSAVGDVPRQTTEAFAGALGRILGKPVSCGYIEEKPFLAEKLAAMPDTVLMVPYFAGRGGHVKEDIPDAIAEADWHGQSIAPVGLLPGIDSLVADRLFDAVSEYLRRSGNL